MCRSAHEGPEKVVNNRVIWTTAQFDPIAYDGHSLAGQEDKFDTEAARLAAAVANL